MRRLWLSLLVLFLAVTLSAPFRAEAQSKTLLWDRYDVFLSILPNGDLQVLERQTVTFTEGTFTFGFAIIETDKIDRIKDIRISEPGQQYAQRDYTNNPFEFYANQAADGLEVYWYFPPARNTTRTFDLSYVVEGGVRIYDSGDKLQWIAIDSERDFPILASSVTVNIPQGASFQLVDSAGVSAQWTQDSDTRSVTYVAQETLDPSDTFEIGVEFTHGVVPDRKPSWQAAVDEAEFFDLNVRPILNLFVGAAAVVLALGGPLGVYLWWYVKGRDPNAAEVPEYISEPPEELPAGLLGTLIDEQADMQDVVATIVDLARKGYLQIEETKSKGLLGLGASDHVFRKLQGADANLNRYEKEVLTGIFTGKKSEVKLSALRNKFYTRLPDIQEGLYKEVVAQGYFASRPDKVRGRWKVFGFGVLALAFVSFIFTAPLTDYAGAFLCLPFALGVTGVVMLIVSRYMPAKSRKGSEATARWLAFRNYLRRIEKHTDLTQAGDLFERYLPYAIAFGMNTSWVNKFSRLAETPAPGWYVPYPVGRARPAGSGGGPLASGVPESGGAPGGPGGLQGMSEGLSGGLQSMSNGLTSMLNSTGRVLSSAPSSAGSGGFSGGGGFSSGGFSGGGGGGGGGRGFG